ncbi:MAG: hypothetical protein J6Y26_05250, partial [Lachnospiraceae bacterium]|nr:hypothetical protein [Lachnospiraceae bacterium]
IKLWHNANLTFDIEASEKVSFALYTISGNAGKYSLKSVIKETSTTSAGKLSKTALLEEEETYFLSVKATTSKTTDADYKLHIGGVVFNKIDMDDDWTDLKDEGNCGYVYDSGVLTEDNVGMVITEDWVGYGDEFDYVLFQIQGPANLNFKIEATDAVKLTIYKVICDNKGNWSLKSFSKNVATITVPKGVDTSNFHGSATTGSIFLSEAEHDTFYAYSVQSTNHKKGGNADYSVTLESASFLPAEKDPAGVDNSGLLIKTKGFMDGSNGGSIEMIDLEQWAQDSMIAHGMEGYKGWVGYGDAVDTLGFTVPADTPIRQISIRSTDEVSFTLAQVVRSGKKNYKTVSIIKATKLTACDPQDKNGYSYEYNTVALDGSTKKGKDLGAGDYIIIVKSTNASKGGNANYTVILGCEKLQTAQNADALTDLSMPETSDALAISNDLSLGQFADNASAISSAVTDALDDKLGSIMNASWTTLA